MLQKILKTLCLIPLASLLMANSQCTGNAPPFEWNPHIYAGDSQTQSIVSKDQNGQLEQIKASDPKFDEMVCMHKSEIKNAKAAYFKVIDQCEKWKDPNGQQQAEEFGQLLPNADDL